MTLVTSRSQRSRSSVTVRSQLRLRVRPQWPAVQCLGRTRLTFFFGIPSDDVVQKHAIRRCNAASTSPHKPRTPFSFGDYAYSPFQAAGVLATIIHGVAAQVPKATEGQLKIFSLTVSSSLCFSFAAMRINVSNSIPMSTTGSKAYRPIQFNLCPPRQLDHTIQPRLPTGHNPLKFSGTDYVKYFDDDT